ncbi:MAG TPA: IS200/IS605 family transposase, partial [Saprospiraceae bacterium]|nr:IS200/IS605 family transposase [Saprospiraceae bacterium]
MANTYTQIHIHAVFAVRNRECLIKKEWKVELYKYMTAIIQNNNHKVLIINGVEDHVHILFGMRPTQALSELMQMIKGDSSKWINQNKLTTFKFSWQEGFGAFSYSKSHVGNVVNYINNQEQHHKKKSFHEEYLEMLKKYEVDFDPNYIFKPI